MDDQSVPFWPRFLATVDASATSYQATNLQEGHDYTFRVFAQNAAGLSETPAETRPPVKAKLPFGKLNFGLRFYCLKNI